MMRYLLPLLLLLPTACVASPKYDVLIVRDSSKPDQEALANVARQQLELLRADMGLTVKDLYIDSYDVHRADQKPAVERLHVTNLPTLAVCILSKDVPAQVQTRLENVTTEALAKDCADIMAFAGERMGTKLPYLGIQWQDVTPAVRQQFSLAPDQSGVCLTDVVPDSPAAAAGLKSGDVVQDIDGTSVLQSDALRALWHAHKIGDTLHVKVVRQGQVQDIALQVVARPAPATLQTEASHPVTPLSVRPGIPEAYFHDMVICKSISDKHEPVGAASTFPTGIKQLRAHWIMLPRPVVTRIELKIYYGDELAESGFGSMPSDATYGTAHLTPPDETFKAGVWRIDICDTQRVLCSQTFTVR